MIIVSSAVVTVLAWDLVLAVDNHVQRYEIRINANPSIPPASHVQRYRIAVTEPAYLSLSLSSDEVVMGSVVPEEMVSDYTVVTVQTTAQEGYGLSAQAGGGDLVCGSDNSYIIPSVGREGDLGVGSWGFGYVNGVEAPSSWQPVPTVLTQIGGGTAATDVTGDVGYLHFGLRIGYNQPPCDNYAQVMTLTAEVRR
jgi:hypothetical protein